MQAQKKQNESESETVESESLSSESPSSEKATASSSHVKLAPPLASKRKRDRSPSPSRRGRRDESKRARISSRSGDRRPREEPPSRGYVVRKPQPIASNRGAYRGRDDSASSRGDYRDRDDRQFASKRYHDDKQGGLDTASRINHRTVVTDHWSREEHSYCGPRSPRAAPWKQQRERDASEGADDAVPRNKREAYHGREKACDPETLESCKAAQEVLVRKIQRLEQERRDMVSPPRERTRARGRNSQRDIRTRR